MSRMLLAAASALVLSTGAALAECSPENWQDCAGKPWVEGDKMETPIGSEWWPNELWGEGDEAGSTNWYTKPEVVQRALAEGDKGKTYQLGHPYTSEMPLFGTRQFVMRIPGTPPADRSAATRSSGTTSSCPPRSARWAPSLTASATSACRSAPTAERTTCASTTATLSRTFQPLRA